MSKLSDLRHRRIYHAVFKHMDRDMPTHSPVKPSLSSCFCLTFDRNIERPRAPILSVIEDSWVGINDGNLFGVESIGDHCNIPAIQLYKDLLNKVHYE